MQSPLITIIIPAFNAASCIREALNSLLQQHFNAFEVLVVDGLSKDNTLEIVKEAAARDNRVRFVSEKDAGIYDAMNKGIRLAAGEWVYFLGADDALYNDKVLETVAPVLQASTAGFVYGNVLMGSTTHWYDGEFTYEKLLRRNISHQAIFYNKKLFSQVGMYELAYKSHADWAFNINCFNTPGFTTQYMPVLVANFFVGGTSSQHDVPFQQEFLLPARLAWLQQKGTAQLKELFWYDEWWRLFRNAHIRTREQLATYSKGLPVPAAIQSMVNWQSKLPPALLKIGVLSKGVMVLNYLFNRIAIK